MMALCVLTQVRMDALLMRQYDLLACFEGNSKNAKGDRGSSIGKTGLTKGV